MQKKHAKDGLVVMSVSIDDLKDDPAVKDRIVRFLTKVDARFLNVLLDEPEEVWSKKLRLESVPGVYVFDRRGKWTFFDGQALAKDEDGPEKLVTQLLKETP